jgi:hypothetical protein
VGFLVWHLVGDIVGFLVWHLVGDIVGFLVWHFGGVVVGLLVGVFERHPVSLCVWTIPCVLWIITKILRKQTSFVNIISVCLYT